MIEITTVQDSVRGCGWRKPGGLYLVTAAKMLEPCGKLPLSLTVCPCCGAGVKFCWGWTWVDSNKLLGDIPCVQHLRHNQAGTGTICNCPMDKGVGRAGLLWIGGSFYPSPSNWLDEVQRLGVSRRIKAVPQGFKLGETWVLVAHLHVPLMDDGGQPITGPAIFEAFMPEAIQYVTKGDETQEQLEALAKRGITPVKVERIQDTMHAPEA